MLDRMCPCGEATDVAFAMPASSARPLTALEVDPVPMTPRGDRASASSRCCICSAAPPSGCSQPSNSAMPQPRRVYPQLLRTSERPRISDIRWQRMLRDPRMAGSVKLQCSMQPTTNGKGPPLLKQPRHLRIDPSAPLRRFRTSGFVQYGREACRSPSAHPAGMFQ